MSEWEEKVWHCPECGEKSLYMHKHHTDGSISESLYCFCIKCHGQFFMLSLDHSYYGPENPELVFVYPLSEEDKKS